MPDVSPTPVAVSDAVAFGGPSPVLIMGPCVIESRDHLLRMADGLRRAAAAVGWPLVFKASFDKANRTSVTGYRGPGLEAGLADLAAVKDATGLPLTTDIHEPYQAAIAAEVIDVLQVPALLCRQTDLLVACARTGRAVTVKKGQFLAPWDMQGVIGKFEAEGARDRLVLIERGTSFGYNTLVSDLRSLPLMRGLGVPVVYDGTHSVQAPGGKGSSSGGAGHLAPGMLRAAMAVGVEGLFMEVHDDPTNAKSDGPNVVPLAELPALLADLKAIHDAIGRPGVPVPRESFTP